MNAILKTIPFVFVLILLCLIICVPCHTNCNKTAHWIPNVPPEAAIIHGNKFKEPFWQRNPYRGLTIQKISNTQQMVR